jgi:hypothetical protein
MFGTAKSCLYSAAETSANIPRFYYPFGAMNFMSAFGISQDGWQMKLAESLHATPFNKELSDETTFRIHLAGQYL